MRLQRLRNIKVHGKLDKFLQLPAPYMRPHKNALAQLAVEKNKFRPKVMLGDLRKPNCEFTSDLN